MSIYIRNLHNLPPQHLKDWGHIDDYAIMAIAHGSDSREWWSWKYDDVFPTFKSIVEDLKRFGYDARYYEIPDDLYESSPIIVVRLGRRNGYFEYRVIMPWAGDGEGVTLSMIVITSKIILSDEKIIDLVLSSSLDPNEENVVNL